MSLERPALQQFSYADQLPRRRRLHAAGHGTATVITPPLYSPGAVATVTLAGASGPVTRAVRADAGGRLHLSVALGGAAVPGVVGSAALIGVPTAPVAGGTTTVAISSP